MTAPREELKRKSLPGQQEAGRYQLALGLAQAVRGNLPYPHVTPCRASQKTAQTTAVPNFSLSSFPG